MNRQTSPNHPTKKNSQTAASSRPPTIWLRMMRLEWWSVRWIVSWICKRLLKSISSQEKHSILIFLDIRLDALPHSSKNISFRITRRVRCRSLIRLIQLLLCFILNDRFIANHHIASLQQLCIISAGINHSGNRHALFSLRHPVEHHVVLNEQLPILML